MSLPRALDSVEIRVLVALLEKEQTTPDAYPLTLNALTNGCNQKSNRSPQMSLTPDDVEQAIDELRALGAVLEVQGSGRVPKYWHQMYEWLGVDKVELAVMAELLLRGEQTVGELRGRASRMEPIAGLAELKPLLDSLMEKKLVISLTPEGRGQMVTHGLYKDRELEALRNRAFDQAPPVSEVEDGAAPARSVASPGQRAPSQELDELRSEVDALRDSIEELRGRVEKMERLLE